MPHKMTHDAAKRDERQGKSASTQSGEYVHEEIEHIRDGEHGAKNAKQAIAIGLSKARRDGVKVKPSRTASAATKKKAAQDSTKAGSRAKTSATRSRATTSALKKEGTRAASKEALSSNAKKAASKRTASSRSASAKKAARTRARSG